MTERNEVLVEQKENMAKVSRQLGEEKYEILESHEKSGVNRSITRSI